MATFVRMPFGFFMHNNDLKVLLVDDNRDGVDLLSALLSQYGIENKVAYGGEEALDLIGSWPADIVFLDIRMPGLDGFATANALRAMPGRENLPIVALSGWGGMGVTALSFGSFTHWLTKPVQIHELLDVIQRLSREQN